MNDHIRAGWLIITYLQPRLYQGNMCRQNVACCRQQNGCQFVAGLLLDTKGYILPRYGQHVAGQHVALV